MSTSPTLTWCCPTTPPASTAVRMTSPRKRRPHGKPPSAGTTSTQSSGLPKFERSEQRQRIDRPHRQSLGVARHCKSRSADGESGQGLSSRHVRSPAIDLRFPTEILRREVSSHQPSSIALY